jgi:hypothetical protein
VWVENSPRKLSAAVVDSALIASRRWALPSVPIIRVVKAFEVGTAFPQFYRAMPRDIDEIAVGGQHNDTVINAELS